MYQLIIRLQSYCDRITLGWVFISIFVGTVVANVICGKKNESVWKTVVLDVLITYMLMVIGSTIVCRPLLPDRRINLQIIETFRHRFQYNIDTRFEVLLNCMMLAPLGCLLPVVVTNLKAVHVVLSGSIVSSLIEVGQYVTRRGTFEIVDIIDNTIGVVVGYVFYRVIRFAIQRIRKMKNVERLDRNHE